MPKFVPVVDTEKPLSEQSSKDPSMAAHRRFDDPHSVSNKVDRGWKQGDVGWGVVRTFGDEEKDQGAQVLKHSEGANKMVLNEKGLWVKSKSVADDLVGGSTSSSMGRGRGKGGVSVLDKYMQDSSAGVDGGDNGGGVEDKDKRTHEGEDRRFRDKEDEDNRDSHRIRHRASSPSNKNKERDYDKHRNNDTTRYKDKDSRYSDRGRTRSRDGEDNRKRRSRSRSEDSEDNRDKRRHTKRNSRSRSRSYSSSRSRSDSSDRYRKSRRRHSVSRSRSRSESRMRSNRRNDRERDRGRDRRNNSRNRDRRRDRSGSRRHRRDRSPSSSPEDRHRSRHHRDDSRERRRDEARDRDREKKRVKSSSSRSRSRTPSPYPKYSKKDRTSSRRSTSPQQVEKRGKEEENQTVDEGFKVTAIQVVNHFQETFANDKLSSEKRIREMMEVIDDHSKIVSLKTLKVYLEGKEKIQTSLRQTKASEVTVSKRIYLECDKGNKKSKESGGSDDKSTFCFDFHRKNVAPGLGDPDKENLLLYECKGPRIVQIWGMVDTDHFSDNTALKESEVYASKPWSFVKAIVSKSWDVDEKVVQDCAHFHDYDHMEVWG